MEDLKQIHLFINDFWQLIKQTIEPSEADEYWSDLVDLIGTVRQKYPESRFVKYMLKAYFGYLEEEYQRKFHKDKFGRDLI